MYAPEDSTRLRARSALLVAIGSIVFVALAAIFLTDPDATRAEVAQTIFDFAELPSEPTVDFFQDDQGLPQEPAINAIARAGVTYGCNIEGTKFCPHDELTRGQLATMLTRLWNLTALGTGMPFDDIDGHPHATEIRLITAVGVNLPCPHKPNSFCPDRNVTQADLAALSRSMTTIDIASSDRILADIELVIGGLDQPVGVATAPGDSRLFVVERTGRVLIVDSGRLNSEPFLDLSDETTAIRETGLLSVAFHPDYAENGRFFVFRTERADDCADIATVVGEYVRSNDPSLAVPTEIRILEINRSTCTHQGGAMVFGPDGYLYISLGDGGDWYDNLEQAQNLDTLNGTVIRIDVNAQRPYAIPADNPLVGQEGRDEIVAWGLRNPWRISVADDKIFIADVGQDAFEEINVMNLDSLGRNFGWPAYEGDECVAALTPAEDCAMPYDHAVLAIAHPEAGSIIGGWVYDGSVDDLVGHYIYGDYITGRIRTALIRDGAVSEQHDLTSQLGLHRTLASIDVDPNGEMYLVNVSTGTIHRIVPTG